MSTSRILFFDLDGTLLDSRKLISEYTKDILLKARQKGILLAVCSGRSYSMAVKLLENSDASGLFDAYVCYNGLEVVDCSLGVRERLCVFKPEWMPKIIHKARELGLEGCFFTYGDHDLWATDPAPYITRVYTGLVPDMRIHKVEDDFASFDQTVLKMSYREPEDFTVEKRELIRQLDSEEYHGVLTYGSCVEMMDKRGSKAYGAGYLAKLHGLSLEDTVAFGDAENDLDLLKACGTAVVMANGMECAKEAADDITASNDEDGVALWIERNLL